MATLAEAIRYAVSETDPLKCRRLIREVCDTMRRLQWDCNQIRTAVKQVGVDVDKWGKLQEAACAE